MTHSWSTVVDVASWVILVPLLIYIGFRAFARSTDRGLFLAKWIATVILLIVIAAIAHMRGNPFAPIMIALPAVILGLIWTPTVSNWMVRPLTGAYEGGDDEPDAKPFYYLAEGMRRKGQLEEAIAEIRRQLEAFPGDYEGYVKLAEIQMQDQKNLTAAEQTLNEFLSLPDRDAKQIVGVLHMLADWHLQYAKDPAAAGRTLQRIVDMYPDTPLAHAARQRIAHLATAGEAIQARHEARFTVQPREKNIGLREKFVLPEKVMDPHVQAAEYVKQLEAHPFDTDTREKLAVLYAEEFGRMDLAVDQLEQLIALPSEPPKHVAQWLNLLATLHLKCGRDLKAAESALHRIMERFPGGALANMALTRLGTLNAELKSSQAVSTKPLAVYEKDYGLKHM